MTECGTDLLKGLEEKTIEEAKQTENGKKAVEILRRHRATQEKSQCLRDLGRCREELAELEEALSNIEEEIESLKTRIAELEQEVGDQ